MYLFRYLDVALLSQRDSGNVYVMVFKVIQICCCYYMQLWLYIFAVEKIFPCSWSFVKGAFKKKEKNGITAGMMNV